MTIRDQFFGRTDLSKQQKYQLRMKKKRRCPTCGKKALRGLIYCKNHHALRKQMAKKTSAPR